MLVTKVLSRIKQINKLLEVEKCRRGVPVKSLLFIGAADTANFYWCPMKSLLSNIDMEPLYFRSYLHDRLLYSLKLGYVKTLPRDVEKLLSIGDEIGLNDIEKLLREQIHDDSEKPPSFVIFSTFTSEGPTKCMVLNPFLSPAVRDRLEKLAKKERINIVSLDEIPPKLRGEICEDFLAERYPTIRWNFEWENYVIVGVPDGITEDFVYEFKTTGSEFLLGYMERSALAQGDLYGFFFRRQNKRVQIYVVNQAETYTWHEKVDINAAISLLKAFKRLDETREFTFPEKWKCRNCSFRRVCKQKYR